MLTLIQLCSHRVSLRDLLESMLLNQSLPPLENRTHLSLEYCFRRAMRDGITKTPFAGLVPFRHIRKVQQLPGMTDVLGYEKSKLPKKFQGLIRGCADTSIWI